MDVSAGADARQHHIRRGGFPPIQIKEAQHVVTSSEIRFDAFQAGAKC
jgi:hypothetical protein